MRRVCKGLALCRVQGGALAFLLLLVTAAHADPAWNVQQAAYCADAIIAAEHAHDIPKGILNAIAKVESGRPIASMGDVHPWPWTINADGQGLFLDSKAAAVAWVRQSLANGARFVDVGCMQVDLQMHPRAFRSLDEAFDPVANADYAARYLRSLYAEAGGNWYIAIGLYHSHTPELAADYRDRVAGVGRGIITGVGGPEPLFRRAIRQGSLHLALAGGGMLTINVNRQPALRRVHKSPCYVAAILSPYLAARAKVRPCGLRG
jgi:hypothetical protein